MSRNIAPDTSPVKAPSTATCRSCAPRQSAEPATMSAAGPRKGKGGQITISAAPCTTARNSPITSRNSRRDPNIFQLPATSVRRTVIPCKSGRRS